MILVDTSVWIDHLHTRQPHLARLLADDQVGCHPLVIGELALGSLKNRAAVLDSLANLRSFPAVSHAELMTFVESRRLRGRGLSLADAALLGSVLITPGSALWTRDKRLRAAAIETGVSIEREQ